MNVSIVAGKDKYHFETDDQRTIDYIFGALTGCKMIVDGVEIQKGKGVMKKRCQPDSSFDRPCVLRDGERGYRYAEGYGDVCIRCGWTRARIEKERKKGR